MSDQHLQYLIDIKTELSTVIANQENHKEMLLNIGDRQAKQSMRISSLEATRSKVEGAAKLITIFASLLGILALLRQISR